MTAEPKLAVSKKTVFRDISPEPTLVYFSIDYLILNMNAIFCKKDAT